jgi:ABC-type amino acid transport system permease subunit
MKKTMGGVTFPYEHFQLWHLMAVSLFIIAILYFRGRHRERSSWYFALSFPGSLVIPYVIAERFLSAQRAELVNPYWLDAIALLVLALPALWIWPLIAAIHLLKLVRHTSKTVTNWTVLFCALIIALYFYTSPIFRELVRSVEPTVG